MTETATKNSKDSVYDLEDRTFKFANEVRKFVKEFPRNISNIEDIKQLVRSSGSVGANYIEANESLSKRDFKHRIKICRKESKESAYWLKILITNNNEQFRKRGMELYNEVIELKKIFSSILNK